MAQVTSIEFLIKQKAQSLGFLACGFAKAEAMPAVAAQTQKWLDSGFHGDMKYMENHFDKRHDPTLLVENSKTVISLAYNYFPQKVQNNSAKKIAKYAYGEDYHTVVKDQAHLLFNYIFELLPGTTGRIFVDSAPVMERQWAQKAGIGWIGKNSLLLRKGVGSFFFLAEIICSAELTPDQSTTAHCGSCTACIDACPTQAIVLDGVIDATKCISYLSIEKRSELIPQEKEMLGEWAFGCDVCQDVCPWNNFAVPHQESRFEPQGNWLEWDQTRWNQLTENEFKEAFGKSPLTRAGFEKIKSQSQR